MSRLTDYVQGELDRPEVRRTRTIEVAPTLVEIWDAIRPGETRQG